MGRRVDWEWKGPGIPRLEHMLRHIQRNRRREEHKRNGENDENDERPERGSKPYELS